MSERIENLVARAQAFRATGRNAEAITAWRDVVARAPQTLTYQHDLAAALGDEGLNAEAADIAGKAIANGLDHPSTHLVYARALSGIFKLKDAEAAYHRVLSKKPDDPVAHRELAQAVWMRTGDGAAAERAIVAAIQRQPADLGLQIMHAEIKGQMGDAQGQFALLNDLTARSGRDPQLCYFAARAALAHENFPAALDFATVAANAAPDQDDITAVLVAALLANGDAAGAAPAIDRLRARQPANQYFIALQATAWRLTGDDRYHAVFDYDAMTYAAPLDTPPGWSSLEAYLDDLAQALNETHCYRAHPFFLSVRHGSQIASITKTENPAMRAFAIAIRGPLETYIDRLGAGDDPLRSRLTDGFQLLDAWSVLLPPDGFHVNHVHPEGWLSSACHIEPPTADRDHPHAGWLKFGEPGCATAPALAPERFVQPKAGRMVIFPSYMWHGTEPFSKGGARLTVAADMAPGPPRAPRAV